MASDEVRQTFVGRPTDLNFTCRSTSMSHPNQPQFHIQIDPNFTSRSISFLSPDRFQFYVQIDFIFTTRSTSIPRPDRFHVYVQIDLISQPDQYQYLMFVVWPSVRICVGTHLDTEVCTSLQRTRRCYVNMCQPA